MGDQNMLKIAYLQKDVAVLQAEYVGYKYEETLIRRSAIVNGGSEGCRVMHG